MAILVIVLCLALVGCGSPDLSSKPRPAKPAVVQAAPARHPARAARLYEQGLRHFQAGATSRALRSFDAAVAADPKDVDALFYRARCRQKLERGKQAVDDFTRAIRLAPRRAELYYYRGSSLILLGRTDSAVADFNRAQRLGYGYRAVLSRAMARMAAHQYRKAVCDLDEVIKRKPDLASVYYQRAWAYQRLGKPKRAQADFRRAWRLNHKRHVVR